MPKLSKKGGMQKPDMSAEYWIISIQNLSKSRLTKDLKIRLLCKCHKIITVVLSYFICDRLNVEKYIKNVNIELTLTMKPLSIFAAH